MASVTIDRVTKKYGELEVIHGVSLDIGEGQFVVLLGPSGCGKSTLLRMIAGLEEITSGEISIAGRVVNRVRPRDRNVAMVFQNYALYAHMSVRDNMAFSMSLRKMNKAVMRERVEWAAEILSLAPYLDRYPRELSGGQKQRVAMGRAIVRDPDAFLFDEPLSNLDAKLRVRMRTEIKELHQKLKTTTIYVTHDQIEAMTMADVVVVMRDGAIEQAGSPLEVYDAPANLFVAQFIGSPGMNLIEGVVERGGNGISARCAGHSLPVPENFRVRDGQEILYGVRPEHLAPSLDGEGMEAVVKVVEPTGPEIHLYADSQGAQLCSIARERLNWLPESKIRLRPDVERIHLFDAASKRAVERD